MNGFQIKSEQPSLPREEMEPKSAVTAALEDEAVMQAMRNELAPRIRNIQQSRPDLIFPLREEEMAGLIRAYEGCVVDGNCLPEEVDDRIAENLELLKEQRDRKKQ